MKTGIGRLLQIGQGDRPMILALLFQAVCTGIFAGIMELEANAVFLETFGADRVPLGLMLSGGAGILITAVYSYFGKQLGIRHFGILNLVAVLMMTAALLVGNRLVRDTYLDFIIFVVVPPLVLITLLGFWITVNGALSPSRGKQLTGLIEVMLIGGMILAFISLPLLVSWGLRIRNVLYLGMGSLVMATGTQLFVLAGTGSSRHPFQKRIKSTGPLRLFSHRFTGLISSFVALGVAVAVILHFAFLWVAGNQYRGGIELVTFLGIFSGVAITVAWMMKRFLFGFFKRKFGIQLTILLSPVILIALTIASAIAGERYGFAGEAQLFAYFFMLILLSRFMNIILRESMENPSLNLIYQTLDPRERRYVKSGIEGVLSQISVFGTGLLLACVVILSFVEIYHITYLLFIFLVAWFFVGLALYRSYRRLLRFTLESDRVRETVDLKLEDMSRLDLEQTAFPMELLEFNPYYFHYTSREKLISLLSHTDLKVRTLVWDYLLASSPGLPEMTLSKLMTTEKVPEVRARIRKMEQRKLRSKLGLQEAFIRERLDRFTEEKHEPENAVGEAFQSGVKNEIFAALYHVAREHDQGYLQEVISLFRDPNQNIQSAAISTAGYMDTGGVGVKLIDYLDHPHLYSYAWSALVKQGERILEELEAAFYKPGAEIKLQKRIITVISAIGGEQAIQLLLDKLEYHHREVFRAVISGLYDNDFRASEIQVALIQNAILRLVQTGAWNLAASISVRTDDPGGELARAIEHEIWDVNEMILMLMTMIYHRSSVRRIRLALRDRSLDERGMAVELLNLLLSEPLKSVLVAYFQDVAVREKIDKLKEFYPVEILPVELLLKKILNRDGTQMGDFIRLCVLERMGNSERFFDEQQMIAQGFHPDPRIRETAAQLLSKNDPERYHMVTERLDFPGNSFTGHEDVAGWYLETTMKLAGWELFQNVGINSLFKLASALKQFSGEVLSDGDYVVLAKSVSQEEYSPLSSGIAIIAAHQPEILEQILYLGTIGTCEAFLIERGEFIELLFDDRELLHVFCSFLNRTMRNSV